jgi:hypothetical protein
MKKNFLLTGLMLSIGAFKAEEQTLKITDSGNSIKIEDLTGLSLSSYIQKSNIIEIAGVVNEAQRRDTGSDTDTKCTIQIYKADGGSYIFEAQKTDNAAWNLGTQASTQACMDAIAGWL